MATYVEGVRARLRELASVVAQTLLVFAVVAYFSTLEKTLLATMAIFSISTAVSARWKCRHVPGFWWLGSGMMQWRRNQLPLTAATLV